MARPKKEKDLRKSRRISLRLTETEYEVYKEFARRGGFTLSELIRRFLTNGKVSYRMPIVADMPQLKEITAQLAAIGNNLNQIAKKFNALGIPPDSELGDCISDVSQMKMLLEQKLILRRGEVDGSDIDLGNRLPDG